MVVVGESGKRQASLSRSAHTTTMAPWGRVVVPIPALPFAPLGRWALGRGCRRHPPSSAVPVGRSLLGRGSRGKGGRLPATSGLASLFGSTTFRLSHPKPPVGYARPQVATRYASGQIPWTCRSVAMLREACCIPPLHDYTPTTHKKEMSKFL